MSKKPHLIYIAKYGQNKKTVKHIEYFTNKNGEMKSYTENVDYWTVKIGITKNDAKTRLSSIQTPEDFEIMFESLPRDYFEHFEKKFHQHFKKHERHIKGEYYLMSDPEIWWLKNLLIEEEEEEFPFCGEYYNDIFEEGVKL